jgi:histidine ammonia-lyase
MEARIKHLITADANELSSMVTESVMSTKAQSDSAKHIVALESLLSRVTVDFLRWLVTSDSVKATNAKYKSEMITALVEKVKQEQTSKFCTLPQVLLLGYWLVGRPPMENF